MLQLLYYFEQAGIGIPRDEMYAIMLSMRRLIKSEPIASIRWDCVTNSTLNANLNNHFL